MIRYLLFAFLFLFTEIIYSQALEKKKSEILEINPTYLYVSEEKKEVIYSPDSDRMKSTYDKYYFDFMEFKKKVKNKDKAFKIRIKILETKTDTIIPNENMPSPSGGFTIHKNTCKILNTIP